MNLVIFDIDGTLTATSEVDAVCYLRAFKDVLGLDIEAGDWTRFTHYTDSGIMAQIFEETHGRLPTVEEITAVQDRFINLLKHEFDRQTNRFRAVPGAVQTLSKLRRENHWRIALATGCWRVSAELKLELGGFDRAGLPLSTSDHSPAREEIIRNAVQSAKTEHNIEAFDKIIYLGDGVWDVRAARQLGFGFIGVQFENYHKKLENEGVSTIISGYRDYDAFLNMLNR